MKKQQQIPNKTPQKPSLVPPIVASIMSALIPGLGQFFARAYKRGLIILPSFLTMGGLLAWRISLEGRRAIGIKSMILKAFQLSPMLRIVFILMVIFYIWIIVDAYLAAKKSNQGSHSYGSSLLFYVLVIFFFLGWQIGDINIGDLISQGDEAIPVMGRLLWPWERAITYPEDILIVRTTVQAPCTDVEYPGGEIKADEPYVITNPTCGNPSESDGTPGSEFTITGGNFRTGQEVEIWWKDPIGNEFRQRQNGEYIKVMPDENGNFEVTVIMPYRLLPPVSGEGEKVWEVQGRQLLSIGKPYLSEELTLSVEKMIETIIIGMMATLFGVILSIPVSFLAARNLMSQNFLTKAIYYFVRTILNVIRSIEPLIWAIIATIVVGLGPFAGILALTVHSIAALAKLYSEAIEGIDQGPIEALQATGANWLQTIVYAVIPQIIPPFVSFTIYRWDINIRMSTVIGFVGGGGIGFLLQQWIRLLDYKAAGIAVWFIAITVMILDYVSAEIREKYN
ncbi:MAG: phosphonate ABC transporter, permease protein PhnE [Anaerolineaceae bacterium]